MSATWHAHFKTKRYYCNVSKEMYVSISVKYVVLSIHIRKLLPSTNFIQRKCKKYASTAHSACFKSRIWRAIQINCNTVWARREHLFVYKHIYLCTSSITWQTKINKLDEVVSTFPFSEIPQFSQLPFDLKIIFCCCIVFVFMLDLWQWGNERTDRQLTLLQ